MNEDPVVQGRRNFRKGKEKTSTKIEKKPNGISIEKIIHFIEEKKSLLLPDKLTGKIKTMWRPSISHLHKLSASTFIPSVGSVVLIDESGNAVLNLSTIPKSTLAMVIDSRSPNEVMEVTLLRLIDVELAMNLKTKEVLRFVKSVVKDEDRVFDEKVSAVSSIIKDLVGLFDIELDDIEIVKQYGALHGESPLQLQLSIKKKQS